VTSPVRSLVGLTVPVLLLLVAAWFSAGALSTGAGGGSVSLRAVPASGSFYASPNPVDLHRQTTFDASGLCSTSTCDYSYSGLPPGCSSADTAQLSCSPSSTGTFGVEATASSACVVVCLENNGTTTLVVNPDPSISSLSASPNPANVGESVTFTASVSGGTSPLTYTWSGLPSSCSSADSATLDCTPTSSGTYGVGLTVGDAAGGQASASVSLSVNGALSISSFTVSPSHAALGQKVDFQLSTSGGVSPLSYAYSGLPPGCKTADTATLSCTPTSPGTYPVLATVTDSGGNRATATATVTVSGGPAVSSASWSPAPVDVGQSTTLTVSVSGGASPYSYSYSNLPPGCSSSDSATITCTPSGAGTVTTDVTVQDSSGSTARGSASITVNPVLGASFTANQSRGGAPLYVAFTSSVSGGTSPYSYSWSFGDSGSSTSSNPDHEYSAVGNYTVTLHVRDAASATASYSLLIQVTPPSGTSYPLEVHIQPSACGPVTVGSTSASDGSTQRLPSGAYTIVASTCGGYTFSHWTTSGGASVNNTAVSPAVLNVSGAANLTATYSLGGPGGTPGGSSGGHGVVLPPRVRSLLAVVAVIVAVWGVVFLGRRKAPRKKAQRPPLERAPIPPGVYGPRPAATRPAPSRPSVASLRPSSPTGEPHR
jgi:PKD repeat protein